MCCLNEPGVLNVLIECIVRFERNDRTYNAVEFDDRTYNSVARDDRMDKVL